MLLVIFSSFAIDLQTTFKKMRKFDKMFLDDVFYNLNSLHKIENGDAPQMQHQAMFQFMASGSTRTGRMGRAKLRGWRLQLRTE